MQSNSQIYKTAHRTSRLNFRCETSDSLAVRCTQFRLGVFDITAMRRDTCMHEIIDVVLLVDCVGLHWPHKRPAAAVELLNIRSCRMNASQVLSKTGHHHAWPSSINVALAENPLSSFCAKDNISTVPSSSTSELRLIHWWAIKLTIIIWDYAIAGYIGIDEIARWNRDRRWSSLVDENETQNKNRRVCMQSANQIIF